MRGPFVCRQQQTATTVCHCEYGVTAMQPVAALASSPSVLCLGLAQVSVSVSVCTCVSCETGTASVAHVNLSLSCSLSLSALLMITAHCLRLWSAVKSTAPRPLTLSCATLISGGRRPPGHMPLQTVCSSFINSLN